MFEIFFDNPRPFDQQIAIGFAVVGLFFATVVHDFEIDAKNRPPLLQANFHLFVFRQIKVLDFQGAQGAQGAELGHAPSVQHFHAILVIESVDHGGWAG